MSLLGIAAIIGAGSALGSAVYNMFNNENENLYNDSKSYNSEEAQKNREWQEREWNRRFKIESEYNSPSAQVARLADAGLNAQSFFSSSGGSGQLFGLSSSPSGSQASVNSAPYLGRTQANIAELLQSAGNFANSIESAQNTHQLTPLEKRSKELANNIAQCELAVKEQDAIFAKHHGLEVRWQQFQTDLARQKLFIAQGKESDTKSVLNSYEQLLTDAKTKMTLQEYTQLVKIAPLYILKENEQIELLKQQQRTEVSKQSYNYAGANLSKQQAESESVLRPFKKALLSAQGATEKQRMSNLMEQVNQIKANTDKQRIENALNEVRLRDDRAYSALHRLFFGKPERGDIKQALKFFLSADSDFELPE